MKTIKLFVVSSLTLLSLSIIAAPSTIAFNEDWQPISSERLIKLPVSVMERALEHDFQRSALASKIKNVDTRLETTQSDLASLQQAIKNAQGNEHIELRHQFLEQKSAYIDEMESKQALKRNGLSTRMSVYQALIDEMNVNARRAQDPVSNTVRQKQHLARQRMESIAEHVDETLFEMELESQSQYAHEYDSNLQKIKQLQLSIKQHDMHRSKYDSDEELTRESYIRGLLEDAEADLALINQEDEMLSYMARLVAMDAQALQIELTYGSLDGVEKYSEVASVKPANMVDFFIP